MSDLRGSIEQLALAEIAKSPFTGWFEVRRSLRLTPSFGAIWYQSLDLGFPEIRSSARDNPDSSGTYDETAYHGSRAVSLELTVLQDAFEHVYGMEEWDPAVDWNSDSYWISLLSSWMNPKIRPRLFFRLKGQRGNARFMDLRAANFSAPMSGQASRPVQMQWVNPSGKIYDFDLTTAATADGRTRTSIRQVATNNPGRTYPEIYPKVYPPIAQGAGGVNYLGTVENGFVARIFSDPSVATTNPRLTVTAPDGTSRSIGFQGLTIPAGQFIEIDTNEKTAVMNAQPQLRQNQYLAAPLAWPVFAPGRNTIDFTVSAGGTVGALAYVEVLHYNAHLS